MKALTTLDWSIVGLYGMLILYLFAAGNGPNSDPAGRGMMGGVVFLLLLFVGVLIFLNLRDTRISVISTSVMGGLPLVLLGSSLLYERIVSARHPEDYSQKHVTNVSHITTVPDSVSATQTVVDFLHWYKTNIGLISQINLVDQQPGKNYSINQKNTERYLIYLKTSELLTDYYLNEWQTFFQERQAGFLATPQNEGPPTGFDYDLVMLTQDVGMQMDSLATLKINSVTVHQNQASVKLFLLEDYEFHLVKQHHRWLINEILNRSAE